MNEKATIFIEGLEHKRFIEPYITALEDELEIEILSFEDIKFDNYTTTILEKNNFNEYLLNLKSSIFITTTPGIGNAYFPKSKTFPKVDRPKYIYVFHSLVSPNEVYSKNSFSGFDIIFSPNSIISEQLEFLVSSKTKIFSTGYPLISNNYYFQNKVSENKNVLIAPSWGKNSLFKVVDIELLIRNLQSQNFNITLRPHPMELDLIENFVNFSEINIDQNKDLNNLAHYDYLISDWSGIAIEFSILTNKKTIYIETPKKIRRKIKKSEKHIKLIENEIRSSAGIVLTNINQINFSNLFDNENLLMWKINLI